MCSEPVTNYDGAISLTPRIHKPGDGGIKEAVPLKISLAPVTNHHELSVQK